MKVLFVISSNGMVSGGHYHSLNHTSKAIQTVSEIRIISIGLTIPKLFEVNPYYMGKLPFRWWNIWVLNAQIKKIFKEFDPDVIHCFDGASYLMLVAQPALRRKKIMYTKCGGANERQDIVQVASDVVLFSKENFDDHIKNKRFNFSNIHLISNRIHSVDLMPRHKMKYLKDETKFNFVRIARIGKAYKESILQAINLISYLNKYNLSKTLKLYVIGSIEDITIFNELKQYANEQQVDVEFVTDDSTKEASKLLYLADAVIGTGRGVMEAMSLGIPTFVPAKNEKYPCLLRQENLECFFNTNFSPRGVFDGYHPEKEILLAKELIESTSFYNLSSEFVKKYSLDKFLITDGTIQNYLKIYLSKPTKSNFHYFVKNLLPFVYYINVYRRLQSKIH